MVEFAKSNYNYLFFHISAEEHCFAEIIVDPLSPTTVATNIIGPTYAIDSIRNAFDANISHWDVSQSIHQNLLNIFGNICIFDFFFSFVNNRDKCI